MGEIRELATDELDALLALYLHLHPDDAPLPPRAEVEATWKETVDNPRMTTWGLWRSGELLASCVATIIPNLTRGARPYGVIENVVTHTDYRKQGLGRKVMQTALDCCWSAGCYKVMLMSGTNRREAHAFYERIGFDPKAKQAFLARPPNR